MKLLFSILVALLSCVSFGQLYTSAGTILHLSDGAFVTVNGGDVTLNNAVTGSNNGKLILKGTSNQALYNNGYAIYGLEINNSALVNLQSNLEVNGILSFENGIFNLNTNHLTLSGIVSRTNGFLRSSGVSNLICTNTSPLGSLFFDNTTDSVTNVLNNFIKTGAGSVTIGNNNNVSATGAQLYLKGVLSISEGNLDLNEPVSGNHLILVSNGTSQARVARSAGNYLIQGANTKVVVERFATGQQRAWRFLTAPLTAGTSSATIANQWQNTGGLLGNANAGGFGTNIYGPSGSVGMDAVRPGYSLRGWNYTTKAYANVTNTTTETLFGSSGSADNKPFVLFLRGDKSITGTGIGDKSTARLRAVGKLQTGNQTFSYAVNNGDYVPFGNPYACQINWELVRADVSNINSNTFYLWDPKVNAFGGWVAVNRIGDNNYTTSVVFDMSNPVSFNNTNAQFIQSGQAFFTVATATGSAGITFKEDHKVDTSTNATVTGAGNGLIDKLAINLLMTNTDNSISVRDGLFVKFGNNFSTAIQEATGEDAIKLAQSNETISILSGTTKLGFEGRKYIQNTDTIFLQMERMVANTAYQFGFYPTNFDATVTDAKLVDKFLNTQTPINITANSKIPFTITTATGSNAIDRFYIVFRGTGNLPNNKLYLTAIKKDKDVQLVWNIDNELGVKEYELQRSIEGINFQAINNQNPSGTTAYSNLDTKANNGINYYRVKMIMQNDDVRYSNTVNVNLKHQTSNQITVFPNPIKGNDIQLHLNNIAKGKYTIRLIDMASKQVHQQVISHPGGIVTTTISLGNVLALGAYTLNILGDGVNENIQLVKAD